MKKIGFLSTIFLLAAPFSGCSSYIEQFHQQIDEEHRAQKMVNREQDKFEFFRKRGAQGRRSLASYDGQEISSRNLKKNIPSVKRNYAEGVRNRYTAEDLLDHSDDGSLWSGRGQENFLFSKNVYKSSGDIVVVKVLDKLKREISLELARAFPDGNDEADKNAAKAAATPAGAPPPPPGSEEAAKEEKIYDNISSVVVEEINKEHLLLRGRKDVLYKNRKRLVELQALISRRDIADDDTIPSTQILESQILVLR